MALSQWILVAISLAGCIYASYTDLRSYRVPNACTFGLIFLGTLVHFMRVLLGEQSLLFFLSLFFISGAIAFALYRFGFMGAGDAKLFWGFCLVVPAPFFQDMAGRPVFPPVVLAINLFGVYFFLTLIYLLTKSSKAQKRQMLREFPWQETPKRFLELLGFLGFGAFTYVALLRWFPTVQIRLGAFMRLILTLLLFLGYRKAMDKHPVLRRYWLLPIGIAAFFALRFYTPSPSTIARQLLTMTGLYLLAFFVFRMFYLQLGSHLLSRNVPIDQLTPGAIAAEGIWRVETDAGTQYLKVPSLSRPSKDAAPNSKADRVLVPTLKGLSFAEIAQLKELANGGAFESFGNFGPGVLTALILQTKPHWQAHGVDISSVCCDYARKLLRRKGVPDRGDLVVGDVRRLPYPDASFDLVVGMEVFEHIPSPKEGLSEAVRILKPDGYAITALPVRLPLKMHLYVFENTQEVLDLYRAVGLNVLEFQEKAYQLPGRKFVDTFAFSTLSLNS